MGASATRARTTLLKARETFEETVRDGEDGALYDDSVDAPDKARVNATRGGSLVILLDRIFYFDFCLKTHFAKVLVWKLSTDELNLEEATLDTRRL